jgi:hypothetical protein
MKRKKNAGIAAAEIAILAPWVIGMRLARFADTRPASRRRNAREATRMVSEKNAAVVESAWAMGAAMMRAQWSMLETLTGAGADVAAAAAAPVRRRVKGNARRLQRR